MNSTTTHHLVTRTRYRKLAFTVSLSLLLSLNSLPAGAQSRNQKRITSVWTGTSAAGSIVHVVSDTAVNDYEAYTRGGRFYVKIPAADLPSARGSLLGRGFDDVQIQRYGDGIIISFHLLPGTAARVQQSSNRLEIVFTIPGSAAASRVSEIEASNRIRSRRVSEDAGPSPEATGRSGRSGKASSPRISTSGNEGNSGTGSPSSSSVKRSGVDSATDREPAHSPTPKPTASSEVAAASPAPSASPSASASPNAGAVSSASPSTGATSSPLVSQASPIQQPSVSSTPAAESTSNDSNWRSRLNYWKIWAQLNWIPILIGSLVALALLAFIFFRRGSKHTGAAETKSPSTTPASTETVGASAVATPPAGPVAPQAGAASAAASSHAASPSPAASPEKSPAEPERQQEVDPDREVFEL